jgi:hypothetical protein
VYCSIFPCCGKNIHLSITANSPSVHYLQFPMTTGYLYCEQGVASQVTNYKDKRIPSLLQRCFQNASAPKWPTIFPQKLLSPRKSGATIINTRVSACPSGPHCLLRNGFRHSVLPPLLRSSLPLAILYLLFLINQLFGRSRLPRNQPKRVRLLATILFLLCFWSLTIRLISIPLLSLSLLCFALGQEVDATSPE